ncbi:cytochrome-c peroxidase [Flavobacterium cyanobacteriorum]|uniref:Cytochrome-c peroxidase n=1 Tax=Flavobacterium cyanobacteriorum TaxID=2022802 RepID=A0A255ZXS6_9FLAO|nr:cytochrome c peroxidase [Flavobacterium cyanobacteriorum]OYQ45600.1 cytochrome-c peroxidase [Flavobacterium cyanobacteriorum]
MKARYFYIAMVVALMSFSAMRYHKLFSPPPYFPKPQYNFKTNPLDSATVELGRALFYDPVLSADNSISCASCHSPYNAFAHTDHPLSHGIADSVGTRNAPALFNLAWQSAFMWDGGVNHLDMQALAPISHPKEMGSSINRVIDKLRKSGRYKKIFIATYGDSSITSSKILKALAQFQLTLVSAGSKYDRVRTGKEKFTPQEKRGYTLFRLNCSGCHPEPLFSTYAFENNGLPAAATLNDFGRYSVTKRESDKNRFKVPSLRNLSYTYPYMHDGRFSTLNQVMAHYSNNFSGNNSLNKFITISSGEKVDLISFLLTLNDKEFVFDKKHQFTKITE